MPSLDRLRSATAIAALVASSVLPLTAGAQSSTNPPSGSAGPVNSAPPGDFMKPVPGSGQFGNQIRWTKTRDSADPSKLDVRIEFNNDTGDGWQPLKGDYLGHDDQGRLYVMTQQDLAAGHNIKGVVVIEKGQLAPPPPPKKHGMFSGFGGGLHGVAALAGAVPGRGALTTAGIHAQDAGNEADKAQSGVDGVNKGQTAMADYKADNLDIQHQYGEYNIHSVPRAEVPQTLITTEVGGTATAKQVAAGNSPASAH